MGSNISWGVNFFQGCPNVNFYRNLYSLLFSSGVRTLIPPLDPRMMLYNHVRVKYVHVIHTCQRVKYRVIKACQNEKYHAIYACQKE